MLPEDKKEKMMSHDSVPAKTPEIAVISMSEKSCEHVTAHAMCEHAKNAGYKLLTLPELEQRRGCTEHGVYIVPIVDTEGNVSIYFFEVLKNGTNIRPSTASLEAGWTATTRWFFKR